MRWTATVAALKGRDRCINRYRSHPEPGGKQSSDNMNCLMRSQRALASSTGLCRLVAVGTMFNLLLAAGLCGCRESSLTAQTQSRAEDLPRTDDENVPITEADVPMPGDYAEAVERLGGYCEAIREAVASGHPRHAHRPLDESNIAIERLPAIARATGVPRRLWEQVVTSSEDLAEALGEIHTEIDAHRAPDYDARAKTIDDALAALSAIAHESETGVERSTDEQAKPQGGTSK